MNDLKHAFRGLLKTPGFTMVIVLTLALGIGANTALFSVLNRALITPLPYPEPDRLVVIEAATKRSDITSVSYPDFLEFQKAQRCFEAISGGLLSPVNLVGPSITDRVLTVFVDHEFLPTLRATVQRGRNFTTEDTQPSSAAVALITHETWQKRFGGSDAVLGKSVNLAGRSVTVIGVLPASFRYHRPAEFFVPLAPFAREFFIDSRANRYGSFEVLGRLKPGATLDLASAELGGVTARLEKEYPDTNAGTGVRLTPFEDRRRGASTETIYLLFGAVGLLLLIACVNVANMLLARACAREKEMAVRVALGASRFAIMRQLLTESLVLSCAGGLIGVLLAQWISSGLITLVPSGIQTLAGTEPLTADWRVLLFSAGMSILTGVVFGLAPAWRLANASPQDALKSRNGSAPIRLAGVRISDLLVGAEVALAAMLLIGAGLLVRSLWRLQGQPLGFDPNGLVTLQISSPFRRLGSDWRQTEIFYERAAEAVQQIPGVESAALVSNLPYAGSDSNLMFHLPDRPLPAKGEAPMVLYKSVTPEYFQAMRMPIIEGRVFERTEQRPPIPNGSADMADIIRSYRNFVIDGVVTESFARKYWPGESAIGKWVNLGTPDMAFGRVQIAGVVADSSQYFIGQRGLEEMYFSFRHWIPPVDFGLVVRTKVGAASLLPAIRAKLREYSPIEPVYNVRLQTDRVAGSIRDRRFNSQLFAAFASLALVLAIVGIYGVISFSVQQRTQEIGVRIALGATREQVLGDVLRRGMRLFLPGIAAGIAAAWMLGRFIQAQLYAVPPTDPTTYVAAACALAIAALLASLVPALRATRVDPIDALRAE